MDKKRTWKWLVVGITIMVILAVISISNFRGTMLKARETVLADNLAVMRLTIKQYTEDKRRPPQSLQDLVVAGYFRQLPTDPITQSNSSWKPIVGNVVSSHGVTDRGITDLHSGSSSTSSNGTIYSAW